MASEGAEAGLESEGTSPVGCRGRLAGCGGGSELPVGKWAERGSWRPPGGRVVGSRSAERGGRTGGGVASGG